MKNILFTLCLITLLYSCTKSKPSSGFTAEIAVDVEKCLELPLSRGKIIPLETSDSSLLYDIVSIDQTGDKYFIRSRNDILAFGTNGDYLYKISGTGQSGEEYTSLSSFFVKDNELYVYDRNQLKVLVFSPSGRLLRTEKLIKETEERNMPAIIYPLGKDRYIAKNIFNGTPGYKTAALSLLDDKFSLIEEVKGRFLQTGFNIFDFVTYNEESNLISYWEPLNDTIYTVGKDNTIQPKYIVNFGKYSIPAEERISKDVYDLIDYTNKPENKNIASLVRYVYEEEEYVYFVFIQGTSAMPALYNKETQHTTVYTLPADATNGKYRIASFLKIDNDKVIMVLDDRENIENNQSLFIIDKEELHGIL